MNNQIREKKKETKKKKRKPFGVWGLDFSLLQIITQLVRWLVSGLISPAGTGLLWEENTVDWLISPAWNQQTNMLSFSNADRW